MKNHGMFRLLIVEDEERWGERLNDLAKEYELFSQVDWVKTRREALDRMDECHYHFVSIDQNIPDAPRELVKPDNGLRLCRELVEANRMTNRFIYTANGRRLYANQVGHLDETKYFEKRVRDTSEQEEIEAIDAVPYINDIAHELHHNYLRWSTIRAGRHLPRALGGAAEQLGQCWTDRDWPGAVRHLIDLWEWSAELAWAQTAALVRHAGHTLPNTMPNTDPFTPAAKEAEMATMWLQLEADRLMQPWWKFISNERTPKDKSNAMRRALRILRSIRNDLAHGRLREPIEADLTERFGAILMLLDLLAGWTEMPMLESIRHHPQRRGIIQFNILAGAPPWQLGEATGVFSNLPAEQHVFLRWKRDGAPFLLDLHPFVLRTRNGVRHEPLVFSTARRDRSGKLAIAVYRSLVTGDLLELEPSGHADLLAELDPLLAST